jgi:hypothetical protein
LTLKPLKLIPLLIDSYRSGEKYDKSIKLKEGDIVKDVELPNVYGDNIRLFDLLQQGKVILIFDRGVSVLFVICNFGNITLCIANRNFERLNRQTPYWNEPIYFEC